MIYKTIKDKFDAKEWAKEFVRVVRIKPEIATDIDTMYGWFSNAIMAGWDRGFEQKNPKNKPKENINKLDWKHADDNSFIRTNDLKRKQDEIIDKLNQLIEEKNG